MTRDLRKYAKQTNLRLFIGFVALLMVIGVGLIGLIYGPSAAVTGLLCMVSGIIPVGLIYLTLLALDFLTKKNNEG